MYLKKFMIALNHVNDWGFVRAFLYLIDWVLYLFYVHFVKFQKVGWSELNPVITPYSRNQFVLKCQKKYNCTIYCFSWYRSCSMQLSNRRNSSAINMALSVTEIMGSLPAYMKTAQKERFESILVINFGIDSN